MGCVYVATNRLNGKQYVGKCTRKFENRRSAHFKDAKRGATQVFACAIRKYGRDAFDWDILFESDSGSVLSRVEIMCIADMESMVPNGYNMTAGGECGHGPNRPETRAKISAAKKGQVHTDAAKRKMSQSQRGKKRSGEFKAKVSAFHKGRKKKPETVERMRQAQQRRRESYVASDETRAKIGAASRGRKASPETRRKMSDSQKKVPQEARDRAGASNRIAQKGRVFAEDHKQRMREAALRRAPMSDETKEKCRQTQLEHHRKLREQMSCLKSHVCNLQIRYKDALATAVASTAPV